MRNFAFLVLKRAFSTKIENGFPKGRLRVAVVGSGPAGFYTAQYLLKHVPEATVDMFEKYPAPFGLVRYGVAPDHPEVKNVIHSFTTTAKQPNFNFFGNVSIGSAITVPELLDLYHAVILSYGAAKDKKLNIRGEDGPGVYAAKDFVGWYNGLPEDRALNPDLSAETAVIIGQGNVALDCARLLLTQPEHLGKTDIADHAMRALNESKLRDVHIVGRRGPLQVAFTIKELRELTKIPDLDIHISGEDASLIKPHLYSLPRPKKRLMELLVSSAERTHSGATRRLHLRFFLSPRKVLRTDNGSRVVGVNFNVNHLNDPNNLDSSVTATETVVPIKCGMVIRSIGYDAVPIDPLVPFDPVKRTVLNTAGRIEGVPGLYCSGWIKRGPVGVIVSTMNDAYETAETIIDDVKTGVLDTSKRKAEPEDVQRLLESRNCQPVSFREWERLDAEEVARGIGKNKPREKVVDVKEMVRFAKGPNYVNSGK